MNNYYLIGFCGGSGAGKTTFIRYLLETLAKNNQSKFFFQGSPTYQRENQYYFNELNCVHFDFYQVEDHPNIDLEDYIVDHCLLIEWPLNILRKKYQQESFAFKLICNGTDQTRYLKQSYSNYLNNCTCKCDANYLSIFRKKTKYMKEGYNLDQDDLLYLFKFVEKL